MRIRVQRQGRGLDASTAMPKSEGRCMHWLVLTPYGTEGVSSKCVWGVGKWDCRPTPA